MRSQSVVITGFGMEMPGLAEDADLTSPTAFAAEEAPFDPIKKLGRKGLLYKDRATKLSLCAAQSALSHAGLLATPGDPGAVGVVVACNLGNVDTVCHVAQTIHAETSNATSPLALPNASSNVIASSVAIRFGCRALNVTLCNGATAGTDALMLAANAIRVGRASRMLVVGVEVANEYVQKLLCDSIDPTSMITNPQMADGAACVILEAEEAALERAARVYARIGAYDTLPCNSAWQDRLPHIVAPEGTPPALWLIPNQIWPTARQLVDAGLSEASGSAPQTMDLNATLGELYGALGVFQCVAAAQWHNQHPTVRGAILTTSGAVYRDAASFLAISAP